MEQKDEIISQLESWAKAQTRVTNGRIRDRFDVDEEVAETYYAYLKTSGIVCRMGYVIQPEGEA
mgnify:CR=1 FL=1